MNNDLASVYRRLRKLLAIAEDSRANPAEAAAAASQAAKLMAHYQLEHSDIVIEELKVEENFSYTDLGSGSDLLKKMRQPASWVGKLALAVAKLNDAQAIYHRDKIFGVMIRFQGYAPDVEVCKFTYRFIVGAMNRSAKKSDVDSEGDFRRGFAMAVTESLYAAIQDKKKEQAVSTGSTALVVIKGDAVARHFGEQKTEYSSWGQSSDSFGRGVIEGRKLDVKLRGVGHTANNYARVGSS